MAIRAPDGAKKRDKNSTNLRLLPRRRNNINLFCHTAPLVPLILTKFCSWDASREPSITRNHVEMTLWKCGVHRADNDLVAEECALKVKSILMTRVCSN